MELLDVRTGPREDNFPPHGGGMFIADSIGICFIFRCF
jgi:hypothetical protein